jgi:hypothetical protein
MEHFKPYASESDISLTGDLVLTRDQAGLALARELQALLKQVVQALEAEEKLPETVEVKSARVVRNPF